ncbi:MAG: SDR family oxidoreductase [Frankia sp.]
MTGASSGIGRAIVLRLAAAGARVLATGRDTATLTELEAAARAAGAGPNQVVGHAADLTDQGDLDRLVTTARTRTGPLDLLVHSAGAFHRAAMAGAELADLDRSYQVNLRAPYALTQALLGDLEATAGRPAVGDVVGDVVFINSSQGITAGAGTSQYAATKHGLRAVADSLRAELSGSAVRICTIYPGRTATPMQERVAALEGQLYDPTHLMMPEDVADLVVAVVSLPGRTEVPEVVMRPAIRR